MSEDPPNCLLYLLSVGKETELVLQVHTPQLTVEDLVAWMRTGEVVLLQVSTHNTPVVFPFVVNFGHIVGARLAPYGQSRSASW